MRINGLGGISAQAGHPGINQETDAISRNLQQQITDAQKKLQDLSSNDELSMEEKMKKRQEIQKEINDLNNQLRQHQIELKREKQQEQTSSSDAARQQTENRTGKEYGQTGLPQTSMKSIISADNAIDQAAIQGSVANKMKGKAGVLKAEISQDASRGGNTQMKEEELANTEQAAMNATASQINTLGKANKELQDAAKTNDNDKSADSRDKADKMSADKKSNQADDKITDDKTKTLDYGREQDSDPALTNDNDMSNEKSDIYYTPIDIRL